MVNSNAKGARRERELVNKLHDLGFGVMKAPASGGATDRDLPDVLAGHTGGESGASRAYAIEAKASGGDPIYLTEPEVDALVAFSRAFGTNVVPLVGVRFDRESWSFHRPDDLYRTDGGNYRVKLEATRAYVDAEHGPPWLLSEL